jgi:hypothetical protein
MAMVTIPQPISYPEGLELSALLGVNGGTTIDAAGEYFAWIWQAREAMTISHIAMSIGTVSASGAADLRVETVGTDGFPSGTLWAANTNVATGALSQSAWNGPFALTASASIAAKDFVAIKMVYSSGTSFQSRNFNNNTHVPGSLAYRATNTGTPALASPVGAPLAVGNSSTTFYNLGWTLPFSNTVHTDFNSGSATFRRGLRFRIPFRARVAGGAFVTQQVGDFDLDLYSDAGSLLASVSVEGDRYATALGSVLFDTPYTIAANTWYRLTVEPTSVTNQEVNTLLMPSADYATACPWGVNGHETSWNGSAWDDTNTDEMPMMQILIDQIDDGARAPTLMLGM